MLPTSGYFRSVNCPFFSSGLCERPHCHFRHVSTELYVGAVPSTVVPSKALQTEVAVLQAEPSTSTSKPDLLLLVREAILQVQKEVEADKDGGELPSGGPSSVSSLLSNVALCPRSDANMDQVAFVPQQLRPTNIAEYRPTPIAQLKKLQSQSKPTAEYAPASSKASSKILYVPESRSRLPDLAVSYIPNPIKKTSVLSSDSDSDAGCVGNASFSDVDDDTSVPAAERITSAETNQESSPKYDTSNEESSRKCDTSNAGTGFDLVNKILSESVAFDTLLSAASARRVPEQAEKATGNSSASSKVIDNGPSAAKTTSSSNKKVNKSGSNKLQQIKKSPKSVTKKPTVAANISKPQLKTVQRNAAKLKPKTDEKPVSTKNDNTNNEKKVKTKIKSSAAVIADKKTKAGNSSSGGGSSSVKRPAAQIDAGAKRRKTDNNAVPAIVLSSPSPSRVTVSSSKCDVRDTSDDLDSDVEEENNVDEECLKIFNEYTPDVVQTAVSSSKKAPEKNKSDDADLGIPGKIRVARNPNHNAVQRTVPIAKYKASPSQIMYERFLRVQQMVMEGRERSSLSETAKPGGEKVPSEHSVEISGKQRVAHVPNGANTPVLKASKTSSLHRSGTTLPSTSSCGSSPKTAASTNAKGNQRIAHLSNVMLHKKRLKGSSFVRPTIPAEYGSKVPTNIRQKYLNFIINECMVIYDSEQDACERGLVEEKGAYDRSSNRAVYLNVVANTIKKLRDEQSKNTKSAPSAGTAASQQRVVSHQFNLGGKKAANVSYSIERLKNKYGDTSCVSGVNLYKALKRYLLTEEQLVQNGFPLSHPTEPFVTVIIKPAAKRNSTDPMDKVCRRCGSTFKVAENGLFLTKDECFYHWGRAHKVRTCGGYETRYSCCQAGLHSEGCCVGKLHVYDDIDPYNLKGFVKTLPKSPPPDDNYGVFALDCEMCYTNMGNELTRITVVDSNSKPVFESLVKPENPIIDYNTRFSGITEADLQDVRTTLRDVQAIILNKFSDKTILIGHSLESDFKALKLIHKTVVDTSVVFPHKMGPPYKRALRSLVAEFLKKIIQNDVDGHDSQEDAASCMQLMLWKIKEDLKMVY